jgi:endonuclease/exonuclease/phosphatase family metal-dependent hydrolase
LKKRTKKLLFICVCFRQVRDSPSKVFCFFFSKKKTFLLLLSSFVPAPELHAETLKISTWNLDWLTARTAAQADLPADVHPRAPEDIARLAAYARKLNADIIGFQEVDSSQAAALVFDPARYTIITTNQPVTQRVGLAIRRSIAVVKNPDLTSLDVEPAAKYPLRDGLDATLTLPGGGMVRILVVHLKTGCQSDGLASSARPQCALLRLQILPLAAWIGARAAEKVPFLILGDFNRVFDTPDPVADTILHAAPLVRATEGFQNPCWDGAPFIDHILAGGAAMRWLEPETLRVQIFREVGDGWKERLSDHCPVSVIIDTDRRGSTDQP